MVSGVEMRIEKAEGGGLQGKSDREVTSKNFLARTPRRKLESDSGNVREG